MGGLQALAERPTLGVQWDLDALAECIELCVECAQTCTACAESCLGEPDVKSLVPCIRANQDCADICSTVSKLLTRYAEAPSDVLLIQLHAGMVACRACAEICETFASAHEHCAACAGLCRRCQALCANILHLSARQI